MSDLNWLFATAALKIAPASQPFWYTSGLIGPYYINTHYLCGGEETALSVLNMIDEHADEYNTFPNLITKRLEDIYQQHSIYAQVIDELTKQVRDLTKQQTINFISGGQRRDWFFAPIIAKKLSIPCLYIYNDLQIRDQQGQTITQLNSANVMNIADLLTAGSSYTEKWKPALEKVGAKLVASANIVDRAQHGKENLVAAGILHNIAIFTINQSFFDTALREDYINQEQHEILTAYFQNQESSMREWLIKNPNFLKSALTSTDLKTQTRAKTLMEKDLYQLVADGLQT